jgi:hypothetical protein
LQAEDEIKRSLFSNQKWDSEIQELAKLSDRLEESMEQTLRLEDSAMKNGSQIVSPIWNGLDSRFDYSWTPRGPPIGPGLGWYCIPKGRVSLDVAHPARKGEVISFGHDVRKIQATRPTHELTKSFIEVVRAREMV